MKLLLDTQVMVWWLLADDRLGREARESILATPSLVSVASVWEVSIKHRLGKLPMAPTVFRDACLAAGAALLGINDAHVIETAKLPGVHEDPFDRLIIAQARVEGLVALSSDARWSDYPVALRRP